MDKKLSRFGKAKYRSNLMLEFLLITLFNRLLENDKYRRDFLDKKIDQVDLKNFGEQAKNYDIKSHHLQLHKLIDDLADCSNWLRFRNYFEDDIIKLIAAHQCQHHLLCNVCAIFRSIKQAVAYLDRFIKITEKQPDLKPYFITLTVKNNHDLLAGYNNLVGNCRAMTRARSQKRDTIFNLIAGAVGSYEITYSNKHGWHPHSHILALSRHDLTRVKSDLVKEWRARTKDSFIVDIRKFGGDSGDDMIKSFFEVFKYALKYSDLSLQRQFDAYTALRKKRLLFSFGCFRGVNVDDADADLQNELDLAPFYDMFFTWTNDRYNASDLPD